MDSDELLPHGYTVNEVERIAASAATRHGNGKLSWTERQTAARDGALDCLFGSDERPSTRALVNAAHRAINDETEAVDRGYGIGTSSWNNGEMSRYNAYWLYSERCYENGFEHQLTDEMAVRQLWSQLPDWHRVPIRQLVELGTYEAAAEEMDLSVKDYQRCLAEARKAARELWFAPEPAPKQWGQDYPGRRSWTWCNQQRDVIYQLRMRQRARIRHHVRRCKRPPHCPNCGAHLDAYDVNWWCPACRHWRTPQEDVA